MRITGRVQGVGYRGWLAQQAGVLNVDGWVRNRRDGSVEAVVCGTDADVAEIVERAAVGPHFANVARVDVVDEDGPVPAGFKVLPTL